MEKETTPAGWREAMGHLPPPDFTAKVLAHLSDCTGHRAAEALELCRAYMYARMPITEGKGVGVDRGVMAAYAVAHTCYQAIVAYANTLWDAGMSMAAMQEAMEEDVRLSNPQDPQDPQGALVQWYRCVDVYASAQSAKAVVAEMIGAEAASKEGGPR
jgi:hypothetical protein